MKTIVFGVLAGIGILGGAVGVVGTSQPEESVPVEYIEFTEPLQIKGYVKKILDK